MTKKVPKDYLGEAAAHVTDLLKEMKGVRTVSDPEFKEPGPSEPRLAFPPPRKRAGDGRRPADNDKPDGKQRDMAVSPVTVYVRSLPGGPFKTAQEVADEVGVSVQAVRKYAKLPKSVLRAPSHKAPFGRLQIYLYDEKDIQEIKDYLSDRRVVVQTTDDDRHEEPPALKAARENTN